MGYETSLVLIQKDLSEDIAGLLADFGFQARRLREANGYEALGSGYHGWAVALVSGWTLIVSPDFLQGGEHRADWLFPEPVHYELVKRSRQARVAAGLLSSVSSTYGFACYQGGLLTRARLEQEGKTLIDDGNPTAEEKEVFSRLEFGEDQIFGVLEAYGAPIDAMFEARFEILVPS